MRAEVRSIWSSDVDDLSSFAPGGHRFAIPVRLEVGAEGVFGQEIFDLVVCSLGWVEHQLESVPAFDGRHHLVVRAFSWPDLRAYIEKRVAQCEGGTWDEVAERVARFAFWEFEDYREYEQRRGSVD